MKIEPNKDNLNYNYRMEFDDEEKTHEVFFFDPETFSLVIKTSILCFSNEN